MTVGSIGTFVLTPGKRDEAMAAINALKAWTESHGATTRVRRNLIAGENSGTITFVTVFEDAEARAAYMDASQSDALANPMADALNTATPPLTVASRSLFQEIEPLPGIPKNPPLQVSLILRPNGAHGPEVVEALAAAQARQRAMGVEARNFRFVMAGPNSFALGRVAAFDSWSHHAKFNAQNQADGGGPLGPILREGKATIITQGASLPVA